MRIWHFVGHKSRTVKVAKSYFAGAPVERIGVLGRADRVLLKVLCPLIVATICQLCCYRKECQLCCYKEWLGLNFH